MRLELRIADNLIFEENQFVSRLIIKLDSFFINKSSIFFKDVYGIANDRIIIRDYSWSMLEFEDFIKYQKDLNSWDLEEVLLIFSKIVDIQELKLMFLDKYNNDIDLKDDPPLRIDFEILDGAMVAFECEIDEVLNELLIWIKEGTCNI